GGAPAVAVRLARNFLAVDAKTCGWCGARNGLQPGDLPGTRCRNMVQAHPGIIIASGHGHDVLRPAPAFLDIALGDEYLEEALCPAFAVHQGAVGLGKGT